MAPAAEIEKRYGIITEFEAELVAAGTTIIKVMLHISPDEQKARLLARLDDPTKQWKFNPEDVDERAFWVRYQQAYEIAIQRTTTDDAPWYVVPADHKWYSRLAVQDILLAHLRALKADWPKPTTTSRHSAGVSSRATSEPQAKASMTGRNFIRVSASSFSGSESATMPAPAYAVMAPSRQPGPSAARSPTRRRRPRRPSRPVRRSVRGRTAPARRMSASALSVGVPATAAVGWSAESRSSEDRTVAEVALDIAREVPEIGQLERERLLARGDVARVRREGGEQAAEGELVFVEILRGCRERGGGLLVGGGVRASWARFPRGRARSPSPWFAVTSVSGLEPISPSTAKVQVSGYPVASSPRSTRRSAPSGRCPTIDRASTTLLSSPARRCTSAAVDRANVSRTIEGAEVERRR